MNATMPRQRMRMGGNANPQKNSFDLSNYWTGSGQIGKLIPIRWDDVTPDSHWRIKTNMIIKLAPILAPKTTSYERNNAKKKNENGRKR